MFQRVKNLYFHWQVYLCCIGYFNTTMFVIRLLWLLINLKLMVKLMAAYTCGFASVLLAFSWLISLGICDFNHSSLCNGFVLKRNKHHHILRFLSNVRELTRNNHFNPRLAFSQRCSNTVTILLELHLESPNARWMLPWFVLWHE